jgi:PBP1b-binding outer membrane lipoprotein LpoB
LSPAELLLEIRIVFMKKIYFVLSSCLLGTMLLAGCSQPPPPNDADLEFKAKTAYVNDPELFGLGHITITSKDGVILITGTVPEQRFKDKLESLAEKVPGVRGVKNDVEVQYVFIERP